MKKFLLGIFLATMTFTFTSCDENELDTIEETSQISERILETYLTDSKTGAFGFVLYSESDNTFYLINAGKERQITPKQAMTYFVHFTTNKEDYNSFQGDDSVYFKTPPETKSSFLCGDSSTGSAIGWNDDGSFTLYRNGGGPMGGPSLTTLSMQDAAEWCIDNADVLPPPPNQ